MNKIQHSNETKKRSEEKYTALFLTFIFLAALIAGIVLGWLWLTILSAVLVISGIYTYINYSNAKFVNKCGYYLDSCLIYLYLIAIIVGAIIGWYWLTVLGALIITFAMQRLIYQRRKLMRPWSAIPAAPYGMENIMRLFGRDFKGTYKIVGTYPPGGLLFAAVPEATSEEEARKKAFEMQVSQKFISVVIEFPPGHPRARGAIKESVTENDTKDVK